MEKYSRFLSLTSKNIFISFILIGVFSLLLFLVEGNYLDFLRSISHILLAASLVLILIYLLPKVMKYFVDTDPTFLFELGDGTETVETSKMVLVLLPIVLEGICTNSLLLYVGFMLGFYVVITIFLRVKKK